MRAAVTREQAIKNAARILIAGVAEQAARTPREAAWYPFHPLGSVDDIEAVIIQRRAEDAELIARIDTQAPGQLRETS